MYILASNLDHENLRSLNCRQNILYKPKFTAPSLSESLANIPLCPLWAWAGDDTS